MNIGDKIDVTVYLGSGDTDKGRVRRGVVKELYPHHVVVECAAGYRVCVNEPMRDEPWRSGSKPEKGAYKRQRHTGGLV